MMSTADLADELGEAAKVVDLPLRDYGGARAFSGAARTMRCDGDNALLISLVSAPGDGRVLVVDGGGRTDVALMGDVFAAEAVRNGWTGVVIDGAVRDVAILAGMPLGVKAVASCPRRGAKAGVGEVGPVLHLAGTRIADGDMIHADEDGVLVVPAAVGIQ
jgi:regulator of ribonuclease activity A